MKDGDDTSKFNGVQVVIRHYKLWNIGTQSIGNVIKVLKERYPTLSVSVTDQYTSKPIQVLNSSTETVMVFPTIRDITRTLGFNKSAVIYAIRCCGRKEYRGFRMRYECSDSWPPIEEVTTNTFEPRRIEVTNKLTRETQIFESLRAASPALNMHRHTIQRCIKQPRDKDLFEIREIDG